MGKFWSLLFLCVPVFGVGTFVAAPFFEQHWLPVDISTHGHTIDHLFYLILVLTGIVFIATELVMFWFMWRYDSASRKDQGVVFMHGSHTLEMVWTMIPTATLLFVALYQMNAWADAKMRRPNVPVTLEVTARQFEWVLRYPGPDGRLDTPDDIHAVNDIHIPVNEDILINLKSMDVLHSFFLPNLRVKQDAVPGMKQEVWFRATEERQCDLVCAELCGWGHYKMKGRLTVESKEKFEDWLRKTAAAQEATQDVVPQEVAAE